MHFTVVKKAERSDTWKVGLLTKHCRILTLILTLDSLNMVNINGQYQMSPENSSKNGTFDIDWGTTDIDRRPFDNDKSISNVPRRNVWDKRKWPVDFKSPQYMCVGDKWYWPVNIKCPPWGSSLPIVSRTFDIDQSISNVPHGGPASPVSQGHLILTGQYQMSPMGVQPP